MSNPALQFGTDEILWYDNGRWGEAGYAIANPNQKVWTNNGVPCWPNLDNSGRWRFP
jgi:hypothetical protein